MSRCHGKRPLKLQLVFQLLINKLTQHNQQSTRKSPDIFSPSLVPRILLHFSAEEPGYEATIRGWGLGTMILRQSTLIKAHLGCRLLGQC